MIVLSDKEYDELIATSAKEGYDKGYQDGKKDAINNIWTSMRDRTDKVKQSNPPEFLESRKDNFVNYYGNEERSITCVNTVMEEKL